MKMNRSKSYFKLAIPFWALLVFLHGLSAIAQEPKDSISSPKGIKIGIDLARYLNMALQDGLVESEVQLDLNVAKKFFIVLEGGYSGVERDFNIYNSDSTATCLFNYKSTGGFGRIGFDYNLLKKEFINSVTLGLRFGASNQNHYAENILFHDGYWGDTEIPDFTKQPYYALWAEVVIGMKIELFKNVFLGWNARGKLILDKSNNDDFKPYIVPGFGDLNTNTNLGFNYYVLYRIPF
jgi:hypothetical protein